MSDTLEQYTPDADLTLAVLPHDTFWAIDETAGWQYWRALKSENLAAHTAEFNAARQIQQATLNVLAGKSRGDEPKRDEYKPYQMQGDVALLSLTGPMTKAETSWSAGTSTVRMRRMVRQAKTDPDVKAVLLRIDSPGGSVSGTADLAADIKSLAGEKPVYAYVEDCCCSAALWVASQCTAIFANATALVGSLGTLMVLEDRSRAAQNAGVAVHVFGSGTYKGAGTDGAPLTPEHQAYFQSLVDSLNSHFIGAVQAGRNLSDEQMALLTDARVHVGADAQDMGLIDGVASLDETLTNLQTAAANGSYRPTSGLKEKKPMRAQIANALSRLGMVAMAAAVLGAQNDDPETVASSMAAKVGDEVNAKLSAHPLLAAAKAEGVETPEHFADQKQRAAHGDAYISSLREQAKSEAVVAFGVETPEGKAQVDAANTMIASAGPDVLKAMSAQYKAIAVQRGLQTADGSAGKRQSAPRTLPNAALDATQVAQVAAEATSSFANVYDKYGPKQKA